MAVSDFSKISGLGKISIELLNTVGIDSLESLSRRNADELLVEMTQANNILNILKKAPTTLELLKWIEQACELTGYDPDSEVVILEEIVPEIEEVLVAVPVQGRNMMEAGIKATDVPIIEIIKRSPKKIVSPKKSETKIELKKLAKKDDVVKNVINPSVRDLVKPSGKTEAKPLRSKERDLRRQASEGLNEGKKEHSRGYIRGVLYPQAFRLRFASLVAVLFFFSMPVSLAGVIIIIQNQDQIWLLAPAATLFLGLLYLIFSVKMKCRICGQPFYVSKGCRKHEKAHRIPLVGYILPTSIHMLIYSWFRCNYCGTSVRLKE